MREGASVVEAARAARSFDVICAGEALWKVASGESRATRSPGGRGLEPGGGPVTVALALAKRGLRVGVATVLSDDTFGREHVGRLAAAGVDVGGVVLARPRTGFVLVDASGGANQVPAEAEEAPPMRVPAGWSSRLLFLSGLSPVVSHAAALCRAARAARREGTFVLLDFNASLHLWAGRDPRTILMVLREVDAARCSVADLATIGMDRGAVRAGLREGAVLVVGDGATGATASGPFGDVVFAPPAEVRRRPTGAGDSYAAGICATLARRGEPGESAGARWSRALHAAVAP
jgi:sugar/nucleoside kinase (ribokinase family)